MVDHLNEGLVCVTSAVQLDQAQNFKEAAPMYDLALFHLKLALLGELDASRRTLISQKVEEYQKRSQAIKDMLPASQGPPSLSTIAPPPANPALPHFPTVPPSSTPSPAPSAFPPPSAQGSLRTSSQQPSTFFTGFPSQPPPAANNPALPPSFPPPAGFPPQQGPAQTRIRPAAEMSRADAFQTALDLSERGKHEDDARNYPTALPLYELALDYYLQALKTEPNPEMKKSIRDRMKVFLDRAEQLKPVVAQMGGAAQLNISIGSAPPRNLQPTVNTSGGICAACGGVLLGSSLSALERVWHPECFVGNVMCAGCMQPFSLNNLLMKIKEGRPYHPMCFEGTTGLSKEEVRSFLGTSLQMVFRVDMPKKFFAPGEQFQFHFKIDNPTSYKINRVVAYLIKTETHMEIVGTTFERKARTTELKLGRTEFFQSSFPLGKGNFEGDFNFVVPSQIFPSEVTGVDASFVREYELVAKCVLTRPLKDVKVGFQVKITPSS